MGKENRREREREREKMKPIKVQANILWKPSLDNR